MKGGNTLEGTRDDPLLYVEAGGKEPYKLLYPGTKVHPIWSHKGPERGRPPVREHHETMSPMLHEVKERRHQITRRRKTVVRQVSGKMLQEEINSRRLLLREPGEKLPTLGVGHLRHAVHVEVQVAELVNQKVEGVKVQPVAAFVEPATPLVSILNCRIFTQPLLNQKPNV